MNGTPKSFSPRCGDVAVRSEDTAPTTLLDANQLCANCVTMQTRKEGTRSNKG